LDIVFGRIFIVSKKQYCIIDIVEIVRENYIVFEIRQISIGSTVVDIFLIGILVFGRERIPDFLQTTDYNRKNKERI